MGWFEEQIELRKKNDSEIFTDSLENIAGAVLGHRVSSDGRREGVDIRDALTQLLKYFHLKEKDIPLGLKEVEDQLDYVFSPSGIMYREVKLEKGWHKDATGAMLGMLKESGKVIALLPGPSGGYIYTDPKSGEKIKVTTAKEELIDNDAYVFYRPFPMRSMTLIDFSKFLMASITTWDVVSFALAALVITLLGLLIPRLNNLITGDVVKYGSQQLLIAVMTFMICVTIGNLIFTSVKQLLLTRISTKMSISTQAATMMRILSLPTDFFKQYSAGELNQYLTYMNSLSSVLVNSILSTGLTGIFSLVYLTQIFAYARSLVLPSLLVTLTTLAVSIITTFISNVINREMMKLQAKERGITYALITGIEKIRLAGAEKRAFSKWADIYSKEAEYAYNPPKIVTLNKVVTTGITLMGTIIMYYLSVVNNVSVADYYAFNSAYAYISSAFTALAGVIITCATIKPTLEMIKPLMEAEPEIMENKETLDRISGAIELSHVSFKYDKDGPMIIDDLSLKIPARQYVAIVGKTGCGKSTLMRLLLGFETPTRGAIFYDKKQMKSLDIKSLRKKIGTVLQNGKLFGGSIFENITITKPSLTLEEAWEAAEIAGMAEDIRNMPMGMHTMVQEGGGGVSGGQRQRLMIARAVAPKPKILMFDEATSALDNITQKQVSDALDGMKCTRIVIAHRLSTIRHCDRIIVLEGGKIIEDGTYEELIEANGFFAELVERQRVDI